MSRAKKRGQTSYPSPLCALPYTKKPFKIENRAIESRHFQSRFMPPVLRERSAGVCESGWRVPRNTNELYTGRQRAPRYAHPPWLNHAADCSVQDQMRPVVKMQHTYVRLGEGWCRRYVD